MPRWVAVVAAALAFFTVCQDVQMVVSVLPALGSQLGLRPALAVWLMLAGSIATVGLLLPAGRCAGLAAGSISGSGTLSASLKVRLPEIGVA